MPLAARIHEGVVWSNRDRRTLLDKMISSSASPMSINPFYFVADCRLLWRAEDHRRPAQAEQPPGHRVDQCRRVPPCNIAGRASGRARECGKKLKVKSLLNDPSAFREANSPVYGENKLTIQYRVRDLLWRALPAHGALRRGDPSNKRLPPLLVCARHLLDAIDIIRLYGLRFKIELSFKQAVHQIGTFAYHFWMFDMNLRGAATTATSISCRASPKYRELDVKRKLHAYPVFIQTGLICQGLLQYSPSHIPARLGHSLQSLATHRPTGIPPSELVVATARCASGFLNCSWIPRKTHIFTKFLAKRADTNKMQGFQLAA